MTQRMWPDEKGGGRLKIIQADHNSLFIHTLPSTSHASTAALITVHGIRWVRNLKHKGTAAGDSLQVLFPASTHPWIPGWWGQEIPTQKGNNHSTAHLWCHALQGTHVRTHSSSAYHGETIASIPSSSKREQWQDRPPREQWAWSYSTK